MKFWTWETEVWVSLPVWSTVVANGVRVGRGSSWAGNIPASRRLQDKFDAYIPRMFR